MKRAPNAVLGASSGSRSKSRHRTTHRTRTLPSLCLGRALCQRPRGPKGKARGLVDRAQWPGRGRFSKSSECQRIPPAPNYLICSRQEEVSEEYRFRGQSQATAGLCHLRPEELWEMCLKSLSPRCFVHKLMTQRRQALRQGLGPCWFIILSWAREIAHSTQ